MIPLRKNLLGRLVTVLAAVGSLGGPAAAQTAPPTSDGLIQGFLSPPNSARPRVWWHWMNGNITKDGVDLDLAWMKRVGIGGFQNFDAALATPRVVDRRLSYMSPEWKAVFRHTAELADKLDLEMTIASSPGWSETGGPWVKPEQAMKKLVWSETRVQGGQRFEGRLKAPPTTTGPFQDLPAEIGGLTGHMGPTPLPSYYADAAVVAYRTPDRTPPPRPIVTTSSGAIDSSRLMDGDLTTADAVTSLLGPSWILYDFGAPQTLRSATLATGVVSLFGAAALTARLESSDDGSTFQTVADLGIGMAPQQTTSFAAATARYFRLVLGRADGGGGLMDAAAPGADLAALASLAAGAPAGPAGPPPFVVSEFTLQPDDRINQFELKAGFAVAPDYYALERPDRAAVAGVAAKDVIDLTGRMGADGQIDWTPPAGRWTILRLGYSLTGTENHPATLEATGLEVDKLNRADVKAYTATYLDRYAEVLGPGLMGAHGVRGLLNDSTEVGAQNWTDNILAEFQRRRGYNPRPWLPALAGVVIADGTKSDAFLYDFRKTLAELTAENHYGVVAEVAHGRGLITYGEALEDNRPSLGDDLDMRRYTTIPMAAMWTYNRATGPKSTYVADIRGAASVAHVYGQNLVAAESMTAAMAPWAFTPRDLKATIDLEFALGVNRPVVHTSVHQPLVGPKPGLSLAIFGQYFNRNETWAESARPWVDYMSRSAFLLQQGRFFADVAYFTGEEAPLTGLYGKRGPSDLPHGYAFDFINPEILTHRLSVQGGTLTTGAGGQYRLLYLGGSSRRMTLGVLRKIHDLVEAGAIVAGPRPEASPALADDPAAFRRLADRLWPQGRTQTVLGRGRILAVTSPDAALALMNLPRDFDDGRPEPDAELMFVHRKLAHSDVYFVDNRMDRPEHLSARFRTEGRAPELWRAETGAIEPLSYRIDGGLTTVPLTLAPDGAVFVVFRKSATVPAQTVTAPVETRIGALQGPWNLSFEPGRGAPPGITLDRLVPWNESADPGVRYFSGAGTYVHDLAIGDDQLKSGARIVLDLGEVRDLAEVRVNGQLIAAPWHAPYRADLTAALKPGVNHLEIRVINAWANRLIGDMQPGATKVTFTVIPTYTAAAPLRPSGLLGPVRVLSVR